MKILTKLIGIAALSTLALIGLWLTNYPQFLKHIFFLRVPLIVGFILVSLPFIAVSLASRLLKNLFVLRDNKQLAIVIINANLAGLATIITYNFLLRNADDRFGVQAWTEIPPTLQYILAIALSLPIILSSIFYSQLEIVEEGSLKKRPITKGVIAGAGSSIGLIGLTIVVRNLLNNSQPLQNILKQIISVLPPYLQKGYITENGLVPQLLEVSAFSLVLLFLYIIGFNLFRPNTNNNRFEHPALGFVCLILAVMVFLLSGLSYLLDYFRVPVFLVLLTVSAIGYLVGNVDHFYYLREIPENQDKPKEKDWIEAVHNRIQKVQDGAVEDKVLVVVAASGGGIQAAGWIAAVLTGLQEILGPEFIQSIGWISSVSGGSVGAMYYLDRFGKNGYPEESKIKSIFSSSTADSLDAVGWGLAYPDLLRFIGLPFLVDKMDDRGIAIEVDWKGELLDKDATLGTWRNKVQAGTIPIPIFNATLVEDGRRFLVSPMTFGASAKRKSIDFNTLYPKHDIDITTAARMSATFPYISPVARPNIDVKAIFHVADGGYFDNFGVSTSAALLDNLLEDGKKNNRLIKKVIFLRINAFPAGKIEDKNQGSPGWAMELVGSIMSVLKVRSSTQNASNALEVRLLQEKWLSEKGVEIADFAITFPSKDTLKIQDPLPLSWQLTREQKWNILKAWKYLRDYQPGNNQEEGLDAVYKLKQKWQEWQPK